MILALRSISQVMNTTISVIIMESTVATQVIIITTTNSTMDTTQCIMGRDIMEDMIHISTQKCTMDMAHHTTSMEFKKRRIITTRDNNHTTLKATGLIMVLIMDTSHLLIMVKDGLMEDWSH
jgi:hypothetical protein